MQVWEISLGAQHAFSDISLGKLPRRQSVCCPDCENSRQWYNKFEPNHVRKDHTCWRRRRRKHARKELLRLAQNIGERTWYSQKFTLMDQLGIASGRSPNTSILPQQRLRARSDSRYFIRVSGWSGPAGAELWGSLNPYFLVIYLFTAALVNAWMTFAT